MDTLITTTESSGPTTQENIAPKPMEAVSSLHHDIGDAHAVGATAVPALPVHITDRPVEEPLPSQNKTVPGKPPKDKQTPPNATASFLKASDFEDLI